MTQVAVRHRQTADGGPTLDAMARLARDSGSVVHVVSPREPGVAERARTLAIQAGLDVAVEFLPTRLRVRFSPPL